MHSLVRRYIKTALAFLAAGLAEGAHRLPTWALPRALLASWRVRVLVVEE